MRRRHTPELMDDPAVDPGELRRALRYIRAVNRRLGGRAALLSHLRRWSAAWPRHEPVTLLDIATGSADLPLAAVKWARGAGLRLKVTATDIHAGTLDAARELTAGDPDIEIVEADAFTLRERFGDGSFDYVHAGLFLHHLENDVRVMTMLAIMDGLARRGLIWNDLMRSRLGLAAIHLMTLGQPEMVRHDARVSVAAGFTGGEVRDFAGRVGLGYTRYRGSILTHRFTLAGERPGAWA